MILELVVWYPKYNYSFTDVRRECGKILRDRGTAYPVFFPFVMSRFLRVGFYLIQHALRICFQIFLSFDSGDRYLL